MQKEKTLLERYYALKEANGDRYTVDDFAKMIREEKKNLGEDHEYPVYYYDKNTSVEEEELSVEIMAAIMD